VESPITISIVGDAILRQLERITITVVSTPVTLPSTEVMSRATCEREPSNNAAWTYRFSFSDQSDRAASDLEVLFINDHYGQDNCIENKSAQWHFRCVVGAQHLSLLDRQGKYPRRTTCAQRSWAVIHDSGSPEE